MTQNGVLKKDDNGFPVMGGTSSSDNATIINSSFNPSTRRLLTTPASGGASGSFTSNDGKTITVVDGRITSIV